MVTVNIRGFLTSCANWKGNYRRAATMYPSVYNGHSLMKISPIPPYATSKGLAKILLVGLSSMYLGAVVAQKGASFLEENEIFVHSEDDDDD